MDMSGFSWAGRRVLITGVTGFKGSWLAMWLTRLGATVIGYSLPPPTDPSLFALAAIEGSIEAVEGDVRDLSGLRHVVSRVEPEIVFHLAAQSLVRASYEYPVITYMTNVIGTVNLLESLRGSGVKVAVIVTSDKCYENREWPWSYRENESLGGRDPYSSSKACAEIVTAAYRSSFFGEGTRIGTGRAGNVIGGGDWACGRLIPDVMRAFLGDEPLRIRSPRAIRPWQHVLEPLAGYLRLAEALSDPERGGDWAGAWNFGPFEADVKPVSFIVERIAAQFEGARWSVDDEGQPHEAAYLKLDSARARERLGVVPRSDLLTAIDWTVKWYRECHANPATARELVLRDIARFEAMAS